MAQFRRTLPAEGLTSVEIKVARGNLNILSVEPGAEGVIECDGELDIAIEGNALRCKQPLGLSSLIGEQQVRIAIDGHVLLDKQIRLGVNDLRIALPASVRELHCHVDAGDIHLDGVDADVAFHLGVGKAVARNGRGQISVKIRAGDAKISAWHGAVQFTAGRGDLEAEQIDGEVQAAVEKGEVKVSGAARVEAVTGDGDLLVDRVSAEAVLRTGRGHIVGANLLGARVDARTGKGDIALSGHLAGLKAKSGLGGIVCRCEFAEGSYELKSGKGDLAVDLQTEIGARIDAFARHGRIVSNLPLISVGASGPEGYFGKRAVGSIGDGRSKTTIFLRTGHGDIRLFRRQTAASHIPTEETAGPGEDGERMILEAVSQGELTVDEALTLLQKSSRA